VAADLPITGLLPDGSKFTGQLSELVTSVSNGVPQLAGVLKGTGLPAAGVPFKTAIKSAQAGCEILNLNIQPIDLDLLGLVVHTDTIHAVVTAVPGAGKLLGNLLCAVAGLLDPPAPGAPPAPPAPGAPPAPPAPGAPPAPPAPGAPPAPATGPVPTALIQPILESVISALNLGPAAAPAPPAAPVVPAPGMPLG